MIVVLTYNITHKKTYDTLCLLKSKGYQDVSVYAVPLSYKKKFSPILAHRPENNLCISTDIVCKNFNYNYKLVENYDEIKLESEDIVLVCGAGLLPDEFIKKYRVINSHPGYIPNCRGLDAFKWAIHENQPIGVTSHLLGDEVDAGMVIDRKEVPVFKNDTFYSLAQRVYDYEISLLVDSLKLLNDNKFLGIISGNNFTVHKRMPKEIEINLLKEFDLYKERFGD